MDPIVITILVALAMIIATTYMFFKIRVDRKKYLVASLTTENATPEKFQDLVKYSIVFKKKNCKVVYLKIAQSETKIEAYGRILYDKALKELQEILKDIFGEKAILCKLSDDVVAVFLNEDCEVYDLVSICNIAVERCSETMYLPEGLEITFSVNVAGADLEGIRNYDKLMLNLSIAMDTAVKNGPNSAYVYNNEVKLSSSVERKLEKRVVQGIKDLELAITYKPYFSIEDNMVKGVEVGLIWTPKIVEKPKENIVEVKNADVTNNDEIVVEVENKETTEKAEEDVKSKEENKEEPKEESKEQTEETKENQEDIKEQTEGCKEENKEENKSELDNKKPVVNKKPKKKKKEKVKPVLFENISNQEDFDKLVEGSNLVNKTVTLWTFENSLKALKSWMDKGYNIKLLMKLHLSQLFLPSLIKQLDAIVKKLVIPADKIVFQINSDLLSVRKEEQQTIIKQIRESGYQLNTYNFGVEDMQSLLFLKDTYESVSITPKVIEESLEISSKKDIVSMILSFCKQENIYTVATNVETELEESHVRELNFDIIQGDYLCGKTKEEEITKLLDNKDYKPEIIEIPENKTEENIDNNLEEYTEENNNKNTENLKQNKTEEKIENDAKKEKIKNKKIEENKVENIENKTVENNKDNKEEDNKIENNKEDISTKNKEEKAEDKKQDESAKTTAKAKTTKTSKTKEKQDVETKTKTTTKKASSTKKSAENKTENKEENKAENKTKKSKTTK